MLLLLYFLGVTFSKNEELTNHLTDIKISIIKNVSERQTANEIRLVTQCSVPNFAEIS